MIIPAGAILNSLDSFLDKLVNWSRSIKRQIDMPRKALRDLVSKYPLFG